MSYDIPEEPIPTPPPFGDALRPPPAVARLPKYGVLTSSAAELPRDRACCPSCEQTTTTWRGPHPAISTLPNGRPFAETQVEYDPDPKREAYFASGLRHRQLIKRGEKGGGDITVLVLPISRERAAAEMYRYADAPLSARPLFLPHRGAFLWQPALCTRCEPDHAAAWYEVLWPAGHDAAVEEMRRRAKGGGRKGREPGEDDL